MIADSRDRSDDFPRTIIERELFKREVDRRGTSFEIFIWISIPGSLILDVGIDIISVGGRFHAVCYLSILSSLSYREVRIFFDYVSQ